MKVALFTDSDVFAGTERHMFDLALGLRGEGIEVRLVCPVPSALAKRAADVRMPVVRIEKGGLLDGTAIRELRGLLQADKIDLVHAHNGRTALLAAMAARLAGRGRVMVTQHFLEPAHVSRRGIKALVSRSVHRWVNRHTHGFIAISDAARTGMLNRKQASTGQISVVPNGMPLPDIDRLASPQSIREELGIELDAPLIVSVARLEREKSLETLIAAMSGVLAEEPKAVCVVAGDGSLRGALLAQIAARGLTGRVKLIGPRNDVLALMNAGDIFVLPSAVESFGLVLIEAMSVKKPVIATRAGGPMEIVVEGETGLLVAPAAVDELSRAILSLVRDEGLRRRLASAGHARFLANYTLDRMTRATIEAYGKAMLE